MAKGKNKTPTQNTLNWFRERGYHAEIVETQQRHSFHKNDLLGFADILVLKKNEIALVQCTTTAHHADRKKKIISEIRAKLFLESGGKIYLQSWRADGTDRFEEIELSSFA